MRSQFVFSEIWIGLRRNLTMTMALIVVVAISLSLLGTGLLFVKQVDRTRTYWQGQGRAVDLPVHQDEPATAMPAERALHRTQRNQLRQQLSAMPQVQTSTTSHSSSLHRVQAYFSTSPPWSRTPSKATS